MAGISFGSINTGLPPNIVEQLIEAERIPIKTLEVQKEKSETKLKLVQDLESKISDIRKGLSELANTRGFTDIKVVSGDPNAIQGIADPLNYQPGSWNVEVMSLPQKAAAVTNGFPDKDRTEVGVGYIRFETPDGDKDVYISDGNNTLEGVATQINSAHVGVRASVINDRKDPDAPFKLVLSSEKVGEDQKIEYPRIYMLDGDQDIYFDSEMEAKNGIIKIDGFEFEYSDHVLKDVIPGVALDIKQATPGRPVNITVKEDIEVVSGKIKTFVDSVNAVLSFIQQQNKMDQSTDTSRTLGGDGLLRNVETRLRQLIQSPQYGISGGIKTLNQLGIQFNRSGTLDFDQKKFDAALAGNPADVQSFFVGDGFTTGFVAVLRREVSTLLNPGFGPVTNRSRGLKQKIDQIDQRIAQKERMLAKREETLRMKFSRLEETMSRIKAQGAQVGAMGGSGSLLPGLG